MHSEKKDGNLTNLFLQEEGEGYEYMSKVVNKQKFEIFNDIYDNAEKEHDMVIISHSKSDWIAMNLGVSQRTVRRWIAEKNKQMNIAE